MPAPVSRRAAMACSSSVLAGLPGAWLRAGSRSGWNDFRIRPSAVTPRPPGTVLAGRRAWRSPCLNLTACYRRQARLTGPRGHRAGCTSKCRNRRLTSCPCRLHRGRYPRRLSCRRESRIRSCPGRTSRCVNPPCRPRRRSLAGCIDGMPSRARCRLRCRHGGKSCGTNCSRCPLGGGRQRAIAHTLAHVATACRSTPLGRPAVPASRPPSSCGGDPSAVLTAAGPVA